MNIKSFSKQNVLVSKNPKVRGFTLIEILVVIGIIAVLAAIVIIAINPARQFAQARNSQRVANVNAILNGIGQNMVDNKGVFTCASQPTSTATDIKSGSGGVDIMPCLVPTYISSIVVDPTTGTGTSTTTYDTGYAVAKDSSGRFTVSAPDAELDEEISITR